VLVAAPHRRAEDAAPNALDIIRDHRQSSDAARSAKTDAWTDS
jgi:hypothetical protein